jgi:protein phosphatase
VDALVQEANRRVYQRSSEDATVSGMGTTATVALVDGEDVVLGHVGDSRAYRLRNGTLEQVTEDHSLVSELVRDGKLSAEEAARHPQKAVITRALGTDPDVDVDLYRVAAQPGDLFLLCSDGLTDMVGDEAILSIVEDNRGDLQAAVRALVRSANAGGGEDNITVILFELAEGEPTTIEQTAQLAAAPDPDEEDTLSGIDAIPPVEAAPSATDTMVVPPEETAQLAAVQEGEPPQRRSWARWALATLLALAVLAAVALLLWFLLA